MSENKQMLPISGEKIETDGIYKNPWGREELLKSGDLFPADVAMGDTEWELIRLPNEEEIKEIKHQRKPHQTRQHLDSGDK